MKNFSAVIFDLDGLLIDTEPTWFEAYWELCKRHKAHPESDIDKYTLGMGMKECIDVYRERNGLLGDTEELIKEYRDIFYELLFKKNLSLMEGARGLIENLEGKKIALATGGHNREMAVKLLKKTQVDRYFNRVVSSDQVKKGKPNPDIFLKAAEELGTEPSSCLVLEDAAYGVMAAKKAGMIAYGINKNDEVRESLISAGADRVFSSLNEMEL